MFALFGKHVHSEPSRCYVKSLYSYINPSHKSIHHRLCRKNSEDFRDGRFLVYWFHTAAVEGRSFALILIRSWEKINVRLIWSTSLFRSFFLPLTVLAKGPKTQVQDGSSLLNNCAHINQKTSKYYGLNARFISIELAFTILPPHRRSFQVLPLSPLMRQRRRRLPWSWIEASLQVTAAL